jgi:hypothetical protein
MTVADLYTIRFDYLPSLKSTTVSVAASFFEDGGCSYVKELIHVEEMKAISVPPYLAATDLKNYLITIMPNAISIQARNRLS